MSNTEKPAPTTERPAEAPAPKAVAPVWWGINVAVATTRKPIVVAFEIKDPA